MSKYIDLVLVKHKDTGKAYLFRAPGFTHIPEGSEVEVETEEGIKRGFVIGSVTEDEESEEVAFAAAATGATLPLRKVIASYYRSELAYDD